MKLFHKLLLLTAAVGMVPLTVGGILLIRINQQGMQNTILEKRVEHGRYHASLIDIFIGNTIRNVSTAIYEKDLASMNRKEAEDLFRFLMTQYDHLRVVSWFGADRQERARAVSIEEVMPSNLGGFLDRVPFDAVLIEKKVEYSDVQATKSENTVVIGLPYRDQGMVAVEISLKTVQTIVQGIRVGRAGFAVLLDAQGRVVAHPKLEVALARQPLSVPEFDAALKQTTWLAATGHYGSPEGGMLEAHQPLATASPRWMLFVVEPESDAFFAAQSMKTTTIYLVVGALLLALAGGLWISQAILSSVHRLLAGTKEIGSGNLKYRIGLESADEIGELSRAFDSMGQALQSREQEIANIETMARSLGTILELDPLLKRGVETVLTVVPSKRAGIYVRNGAGMKLRHAVGELPETIELGDAFREATEAVLKAHTLYVPLRHEDHLLGSLVLEDRNDGRPFEANDRRFVQVIGSSIGLAMRNIELLSEMVEKARMSAELKTAEVVQQTLFPQGDLMEPALHLSGYIRSASETGGDWYGYIREPGGTRVVVMIGDVTGHGVPAALVTAATHSFFRSLEQFSKLLAGTYGRAVAIDLLSPGLILGQLNKIILASADRQLLMTMFVGTLDPRAGSIVFASAGHPFPFLYRSVEGISDSKRLTVLKANGPRLGEDPDHAWQEQTEQLGENDVIVWTTDGTPDCVNEAGETFGERRMRKLIQENAKLTAAGLREKLVTEIEGHRAGAPLKDDVTIVVGKLQALDTADVILGDATPGTMEALARCGLRVQGHLTGDGALAAIRTERPTLFVQAVPKGPPTGNLAATAAEARKRCPKLTTAWMTSESFEQVIPLVGETPTSVHIFGLNPDLDPMELAAVGRATGEDRPVRLEDVAERVVASRGLSASSMCDDASGQVIGWARSEGATESALEALKTVLDEMLTNAFYHAPMDASGDPRYSKQDRSAPVVLPDGREIRMRWGVRGDDIAVEVMDPYGSFTAARFLDHVKRGLAAGTADLKFLAASAGAGLGVFMLTQTANRVFLGIDRGRSTSVICQVDMRARRKKLAEWIRSIHVVERA